MMARAPGTLRVATYNVHACVGTDGRHDPDRVAAVVEELDADVVALQEFTYPAEVALETRAPVTLAVADYEWALGPTRETASHWFGNALLTRHPLVDIRRLDLSVQRREARGALAATIDVRGARIHVLAAHLGLRVGERRFQVEQILRYLDAVQDSLVVVLGDFNDWLPGRTVVDVLDDQLGRLPRRRSFPSRWPVVSLDRIWVSPPTALRRIVAHRSAQARRASDHLPVLADIDLAAAAAAGVDVLAEDVRAEAIPDGAATAEARGRAVGAAAGTRWELVRRDVVALDSTDKAPHPLARGLLSPLAARPATPGR
jgi:endonuclease/exonuclease/phosphatase family metal-dependent hydrolase